MGPDKGVEEEREAAFPSISSRALKRTASQHRVTTGMVLLMFLEVHQASQKTDSQQQEQDRMAQSSPASVIPVTLAHFARLAQSELSNMVSHMAAANHVLINPRIPTTTQKLRARPRVAMNVISGKAQRSTKNA